MGSGTLQEVLVYSREVLMAKDRRSRAFAIAILRGIDTRAALPVCTALYESGFRMLEVPLNTPGALHIIQNIRENLPADCLVGAGTVLSTGQVRETNDAGAQFIVSPNTNPEVITASISKGLDSYPGACTPSEAFLAVEAGAKNIKIFPAVQVGTKGLSAWKAVLPKDVSLIPVGGVSLSNMKEWAHAGADGFGLGGSLYSPGFRATQVGQMAEEIVRTLKEINEMRGSS